MAELIPVESSMIQAVGYDADTRTLEVLFNSGRLYGYEGVPPKVYEELMASDSKGGYMRSEIIDMYPDFPISRRRRRQRQTPLPGDFSMSDYSVSRFPIPDLNDLPEDIRNRILAVQEKSGFIPNVFLALAHRPDEFRAFFAYHDALMEKQGGLTKGEREMIVVATSGLNQCLYCVVAHGAILRIREKNPLIADQLATNYRKADITPRQKAMLDFAAKVSLQAYEVSDTDIEALHAHAFSDEDIWDIGAITALFSLSNRMAHLTNMRPNDEFYLLGRVAPPPRVTKKRAKAETAPNRTKSRR